MINVPDECAAMAAAMLDGEIAAIVRRLSAPTLTPLQRAVVTEARKRNLVR